jgi:DNA-binding LytR/AlgR family response regulator
MYIRFVGLVKKLNVIAMKTQIHLGARAFASPSDILNLEAKENYTLIHFADNTKLLSSTTMGTIEKRLEPYRFFRVNRSTIINLEHLDRFSVFASTVTLRSAVNSKPAFRLSRRRIAAFEACVNL